MIRIRLHCIWDDCLLYTEQLWRYLKYQLFLVSRAFCNEFRSMCFDLFEIVRNEVHFNFCFCCITKYFRFEIYIKLYFLCYGHMGWLQLQMILSWLAGKRIYRGYCWLLISFRFCHSLAFATLRCQFFIILKSLIYKYLRDKIKLVFVKNTIMATGVWWVVLLHWFMSPISWFVSFTFFLLHYMALSFLDPRALQTLSWLWPASILHKCVLRKNIHPNFHSFSFLLVM